MIDHARKGQKWMTEEFYKIMDVYGFRAVMFVASDDATSGSVIAKQDRISPTSNGLSHCSCCR